MADKANEEQRQAEQDRRHDDRRNEVDYGITRK